MTVKTPTVAVAPDKPARRPFRNLPGRPPKGRYGTYSDEYVARIRRDKREAEEKAQHYARLSGHVEGVGKAALMYLRMGRPDTAAEILAELEDPE